MSDNDNHKQEQGLEQEWIAISSGVLPISYFVITKETLQDICRTPTKEMAQQIASEHNELRTAHAEIARLRKALQPFAELRSGSWIVDAFMDLYVQEVAAAVLAFGQQPHPAPQEQQGLVGSGRVGEFEWTCDRGPGDEYVQREVR